MRNVFFALIFANFAYFAWARWVDTPRPPPVNENISRLPRLKLASEAPASQPPAGTAEKTSFNLSAGCMSVGPFGDVDNSAKAAAVLRAKGFDPRQRAELGQPATEYQVSVSTLTGDAEGSRTLKELLRLKFKDAAVIPDESLAARHVSLGAFNERARAEQRMSAAKLKGFEAQVAEQKRPGTVYWIDMAPPSGMGGIPLQDLFAEGINSKLAVRPCPAQPKTLSAKDVAGSVREARTAAVAKLP